MKKRKLKNYLRIGVFLFGIFILLWSCEKEDSLELQSIENGNPFIKRAKLSTLKDLSSFVARLQDGDSNISRNSLEDANHFTILEDRDVFIYTDSISTTYTLAIRKENQEPSSFSNLIVKFEENATTKASILNYVPTQQYLTAYNLDERAPFEGTVSYESLEYDGSLDHLNSRVIETCYTYTITYCDAPATYGGELVTHVATEGCNPDHMWTERYTVCPEPTEIVPPDPDDSNDGGGGGDSGDGTTAPIPPCESTGSDTGISGADSDCIIVDPCESIKSQMNDPDFTDKKDELRGKTGETKESGYSQDIDGNYTLLQSASLGHAVSIIVNRFKTIGFIHNHLDAILTDRYDRDGKQIEEVPIKMFSPSDLIKFLTIAKNTKYNSIPLSTVYGTMVSSKGTYTLKFTGNQDDILATLNTSDLEGNYIKTMNDYSNKAKGFLHFLKEYVNIEGIRLYRIKLDGSVEEQKLKSNGGLETVPCN
ncbi:MAG: hypothetical protein JXR05_11370 [Flavobacteriaceae bacterium]